jgi:hypothetical protein
MRPILLIRQRSNLLEIPLCQGRPFLVPEFTGPSNKKRRVGPGGKGAIRIEHEREYARAPDKQERVEPAVGRMSAPEGASVLLRVETAADP